MTAESYSVELCIDIAGRLFSIFGCPLCGERHPLRIHAYVERRFTARGQKQRQIIVVFRIFCENNQNKRRRTGKEIQYTLTILPSFLQPYSRFHLGSIVYAFVQYLSRRAESYLDAAVDMGAENAKTFARYFRRMKTGIGAWTSFLHDKLLALDDETPWGRKPKRQEPLTYRWTAFVRLGKRLAVQTHRLPDIPLVLRDHRGYVFALLSQNRLGLGPKKPLKSGP